MHRGMEGGRRGVRRLGKEGTREGRKTVRRRGRGKKRVFNNEWKER